MPRQRQPWSAKKAEKRLDKLWQQAIKARDKVCQRTGRTANLQAAHIFSRSQKSVRHDLENGILLSAGIHLFWAHKNPVEFTEWVRARLGQDRFDLLMVKASKPSKPLDPLREAVIAAELKAEIAKHEVRK